MQKHGNIVQNFVVLRLNLVSTNLVELNELERNRRDSFDTRMYTLDARIGNFESGLEIAQDTFRQRHGNGT